MIQFCTKMFQHLLNVILLIAKACYIPIRKYWDANQGTFLFTIYNVGI